MSDAPEMRSEQAAVALEVVEEVVTRMGFPEPVHVDLAEDEEQITLNLTSAAPLGLLIGKGGQTLNALEMLVKEIVYRRTHQRSKHIMVDAESYRARQAQRLVDLAKETAEQVLATGERVSLEPMAARDRRTVHMVLSEIEGVSTYSVGEEPYRHLVVCLTGQEEDEE